MTSRKDMIGHDPLAWLSDSTDKPEKKVARKKKASAAEKKATPKKKVKSKKVEKTKPTRKKTAAKQVVAKKAVKGKAASKHKTEVVAKIDNEKAANVIELSAMQTIAQVSEQHKQWLDILQTKYDITIDGSQVTNIDAASLQMIYALWNEAIKEGKNISWQNPSDALCDAARLVGMESGLQLDKVA